VITVGDEVIVGFDRQRLEVLLAREMHEKARLGAAVTDAVPRLQVDGAYVGRVKADSPAERAGLRPGDVILELDRQPVRNAADAECIVGGLRKGSLVRIVYARQGQVIQGELMV